MKQRRSKLSSQDLVFVKDLASAVTEESRIPPLEKVGQFVPNTSDCTLVRPGGRGC